MLERTRNLSWRVNLVIVVVSLLCCTAVAELAIRFLVPEYWFVEGDEYWKARQRVAPRSIENGAVDAQFDSELGWRMKPFWESPGAIHNSHGYRAAQEFTSEPQGLRIVALGDSFTYGLGVENDTTFSAVLGEISDAEVINAGVNEYGLDQMLLLWEQETKQFGPAIVILGYFTDDFNRNALSIRNRPKPYFVYDNAQGEFRLSGVPVPSIQQFTESGKLDAETTLRVWQLLTYSMRRILPRFGIRDISDRKLRAQLSEYLLKRLRDSVAETGAHLLVLVIGDHRDGIEQNLWIERTIVESCQAHGIDCINVAAEMRNHDFESFYASNGHWSEEGHRFVAEKIADFLELSFPD